MRYDLLDIKSMAVHLREHAERVVLSPDLWDACKLSVSLNWTVIKYDKSEKDKLPDKAGVYTFVVKPGIVNHPECAYILYVGKTDRQTLKRRFLQYFSEEIKDSGRVHIRIMLDRWKGHLWYCFAPIDDVSVIDDVEDALRNAFVPPMNKEFKGIIGAARKAF
jgi:hypothetical protein